MSELILVIIEAGYGIMSKPVSSNDLLRWLDGRKPVSYTDRRTTPRAFAKKA